MRVIESPQQFTGKRPACVAIGMFDGVHLGHQQVIRQSLADAEHLEGSAVVITFDRHPNSIVAPERVPLLIYPLAQRLRAIAALSVHTSWVIRFDDAFSRIPGKQFVRSLTNDLGLIGSICVGQDFHFGHKRSGNVALLKETGADLDFRVHGLASVALDGETVSSTRIREAIRKGEFDAAGQMLGRDYALCGSVIRGDGVGRKLGFPTANLDATGLALPPPGVYAVHVHVGSERYRGALNIGFRPTVPGDAGKIHVEAHLLDFSRELYGQEIEISFVEKLRDEKKFGSMDELKAQIAMDVRRTREIFL